MMGSSRRLRTSPNCCDREDRRGLAKGSDATLGADGRERFPPKRGSRPVVKRLLRRVLNWLGRALWRFTYGRLRLRPIVSDIRLAQRQTWADDVIVSMKLVDEGHVARYPVEPSSPAYRVQRWVFDDAHLVHLRGVNVLPDSGLAVHPGNRLLFTNSVGSVKNAFGYKHAMRWLYWPTRADRVQQIDEAMAVANADNWFHFAFEDLPGILDATSAGLRPTLLMAGYELASIREFLGAFDLPVKRFPRGSTVQCRNFFFRTHEAEPEFVRTSVAQAVRTFGLAVYPATASPAHQESLAPERVYISRSRSRRRSMLRERELERELQALGFAILFFEDLTMEQHIAQMRNASVVVGPHGAGLTHILWAAKDCRVVEIVPSWPPGTNHCYVSLAHALGFVHRQIPCNPSHASPAGEIPVATVLAAVKSLLP